MYRLWLIVVALAACKHYDRARMEAVCKGEGYADAAAYDPAATPSGKYPLALVMKWTTSNWALNTPKPFQAATDTPSADNYKDVALALCVEQQPGAYDRDCKMDSMNATMELGDGDPKVDVKAEAGPGKVIKAYASHYVLTMREAKTAKIVATKSVDVPVTECPMIVLGDHVNDYAEIADDVVIQFAAPLLPKAVAAKLAH